MERSVAGYGLAEIRIVHCGIEDDAVGPLIEALRLAPPCCLALYGVYGVKTSGQDQMIRGLADMGITTLYIVLGSTTRFTAKDCDARPHSGIGCLAFELAESRMRDEDLYAIIDALPAYRTLDALELHLDELPLIGARVYERLAEVLPRSTITNIAVLFERADTIPTRAQWHDIICNSRVRAWRGPVPQPSSQWRAFQHDYPKWNEEDHFMFPVAIRRVIYAVLMVARSDAPRARHTVAGHTLHLMPTELLWLLFEWIARLNYFE